MILAILSAIWYGIRASNVGRSGFGWGLIGFVLYLVISFLAKIMMFALFSNNNSLTSGGAIGITIFANVIVIGILIYLSIILITPAKLQMSDEDYEKLDSNSEVSEKLVDYINAELEKVDTLRLEVFELDKKFGFPGGSTKRVIRKVLGQCEFPVEIEKEGYSTMYLRKIRD